MDFYKMIQWMKRRKAYKYFFPIEKQLQYLKHVHFLMSHGYSFKDALDHLYYNTDYEAQTKEIITAFKRGDPLDKAFEHAMFHHSIVAYLQFSHAHESMIDSIKNCVDMVEYRLSYIEKLKKTIRYPLFLLIIIVLLLISLNRYVLPMFLDLFQSHASSSKTLLLSISFIEFITTFFLVLLLILFIFSFIWKKYKPQIPIETQLNIYKKIPFYRSFLTLYTSYYLVTYISMYLKASLPMREVVKQLKSHDRLTILAYYGEEIDMQLEAGQSLATAVNQLYFIDRHTKGIFSRSMDQSSFEKDLSVYAVFLGEKIRNKLVKIIQFIQPVIFSIVAFFIIFVYLTLMIPMYQLIQTI